LLLGGDIGCSRAICRRPRLRIVDYGKHLTSLDAIAFVNANFDDVPHHLTREIARLRGTYRSYGFHKIGNLGRLQRNHGNVPHGFWRRSGVLPI
jgi:hypothetical protein